MDKFITKHKTKCGNIFDVYIKSKKIIVESKIMLLINLTNIECDNILCEYFISNKNKNLLNYRYLNNNFYWDHKNKLLFENDNFISLTKKEVLLISIFISNIDRYLDYEEIIYLSNKDITSYDSLTSYIKRIRQKTSKGFIKSNNLNGYGIFQE
jgi:DNA-binding response OmpR family regulator